MKRIFLSLLVLLSVTAAFGQARTVSGTVTSDEGETLPGAAVLVDGTNIGTITDIDGKYVISVPEGAEALRVSYVGMKTKVVEIGSGSIVNVSLMSDLVELDRVLVTALGVRKEEKALGYSAQSVGGDEVAGSGEINAIQGLAGKAAGIQVVGSGGVPGASSKILIRGNSSFQRDNQPLIIVDGVPISNETEFSVAGDFPFNAGLSGVNQSNRAIDINPEDIESVTVLKGPVAAAQYGTRAANGAIIYTTKKGKMTRGKGINAEVTYSIDFSQVNKLPEMQSTYAQGSGGGTFDTEGNYNSGTYDVGDPGPDGQWFTADDVSLGTSNSWGPAIADLPGVTATDNLGEFFETATSHNVGLALSGGNEVTQLRFSANFTDQTGIVPNTDFQRMNVGLNGNTQLSDKLSLSASMNYIKSGGTRAQNGSNLSGVMLALTRTPASFDLLGGPGPNGYDLPNGLQHQYFYPYDNPYWSAFNNPFTDNVNRFFGNANLVYEPLDWLTVSYRLGTDVYSDQRKQIFAIGAWDPANAPGGEIYENKQNFRQVYGDLAITATRQLTDDIGASLTVGNNIWQQNFEDLYSRGRDLTIPGFYNLSNATDLYASEATTFERSTALFANLDLDWKSTLFLNGTLRNEWSSTFGVNNSSFLFGSASASFAFTELMNESNVLTFGKIRVGYASVGLQPAPYSSATYFLQETFTDGFTDGLTFPYLGVNGFGYSDVLGNADLKPERTNGLEGGVDLRFFNGRLNADITVYQQRSTDILLQRPIAASTGFRFIESNAGEMTNTGVEVVLSGDPVRAGKFNWNIVANFARNVNEVVSLAEGVDEFNIEAAFASVGPYAIVGEPYGLLYGTQYDRSADGEIVIDPATGLPLIDPLRGGIGNPFPDWTLGLRNTFTYAGLSVSALLDIRQGGDVWCGTCARLNRLGRTEATADRERTYVIEGQVWDGGFDENDNPTTTGETNTTEVDANTYFVSFLGDGPGSASEENIQDGGWIRLRELTVAYDFNISSDLPVLRDLSLFFTGRNLWLQTDYEGVDPETSLTGAGSNANGIDYFNMPNTKSYIFGLRANF